MTDSEGKVQVTRKIKKIGKADRRIRSAKVWNREGSSMCDRKKV